METVNAKPNITLVESPEELAQEALRQFLAEAEQAIRDKGAFCVALSGGHTPERLYELLGDAASAVPWDKVHIFWVDERFVPPEDEGSNYGLAAHTFLSKVGIPEGNVHRMSGEFDSYDRAVAEYEDTIREVFGLMPGQKPHFDLIVLGMCPDGHVGSLYPNTYALFDTDDLVSAVYLMDGDYNRLTLTYPVLSAAKRLLILISGAEKAQILKEVMESEPDEVRYPVHALWPILDKVTWIVDRQAGRLLQPPAGG